MPVGITDRELSVMQDAIQKTAPSMQLRLQKQKTVSVSLESVVFADGQALGADSNNAIAQIKAHIDVEREVYTEVVRAFESGGQPAVSEYLKGLTAKPAAGVLRAAKLPKNEAYAAFAEMVRGRMGRTLSDLAQKNVALVVDLAQRHKAKPTISIHP
jgi:hypothetical protein